MIHDWYAYLSTISNEARIDDDVTVFLVRVAMVETYEGRTFVFPRQYLSRFSVDDYPHNLKEIIDDFIVILQQLQTVVVK